MILPRRMPDSQNNPIYSAKQDKKSVLIRSTRVIRVPTYLKSKSVAVNMPRSLGLKIAFQLPV